LDTLDTEELARGCFTDGIWCGWRHNAAVRGIGVSVACLVVPRGWGPYGRRLLCMAEPHFW